MDGEVMMRRRVENLLQVLSDCAIWLLFKGTRVRS
jgi:hypothetical protein